MNNSALRIISFIVLIVTFIVVSGIVSTASALMHDNSAETCCDLERKDESGTANPCETPECSCVSCINAIVKTGNDLPKIIMPLGTYGRYLNSLINLHPHEYIASIEYPPEES